MIVLAGLVALSAFDLSCKTLFMSTGTDALPQKMTGETGPFFKINLATGRFCQGSCRETYIIPKVTATDLILKAVNTATDKQNLRISRESGDFISTIQIGSGAVLVETGTCEAKPFTGFPSRKF